MLRIFKKEGRTQEQLDQLSIYIFLGTLIGARLGHCLFYDFDYYKDHILEIFLPFKWDKTGFILPASQDWLPMAAPSELSSHSIYSAEKQKPTSCG
nr:prolipoprotein diacylglyceryl transferase family protein [Sphingobacterium multivorum]